MDRFEDRTVVVTGGGGGIGSAVCAGFAAEGARVAVLDRAADAAEATAAGIVHDGGRAIALGCDITERDSVDAAVARVADELFRERDLHRRFREGVGARLSALEAALAEHERRLSQL